MKPIQYLFVGALVLLSVLWLLADTFIPQPFTYFSFRGVFIQYSGLIGVSVMSIAMLLAVRPKWLEPRLKGLDKMYRLHKWLGITGLVFAVLHWWWAQGTKWMVGWGWLERPQRRPPAGGETLGSIESWLRGQRELAESVGEWAFYAAVVLIALALIKRFPYHLFAKTHKILALAYLVLAYHALVLTKTAYWTQPVGWLLALLLLGGSLSALWVLAGRVGTSRKFKGVIEKLEHHPEMHVLESVIRLDAGWPGHTAGQFAFATSNAREGAHPYTIASAWDPDSRRITFITKALGDHTERLPTQLKTGMEVTVEGPYGCFDFQDEQLRQIWVGAGIGITPFVARMKQLAETPEAREIDFFHPTREITPAVQAKLQADVSASNVNLHLMLDQQDGPLSGEKIRSAVPEWQSASIWFCGPAAFGQMLRKDMLAHGLPPERFHQELFAMR